MKIINQKAFTLIEITFLLVIFGLLMGSLLAPISAIVYQYNINYTENQLEEIKEALLGFAVLHKRLPCPDSNGDDGIEDTNCDTEGDLPWATLGVGKNDVWGNAFRYRVDKNYAETTGIPSLLETDTANPLIVKKEDDKDCDAYPDDTTFLTPKNYSSVVVIVFSRGRNSESDSENLLDDECYIQDFIPNEFDDHLTWLSKQTVMYQLIAAKQWFP